MRTSGRCYLQILQRVGELIIIFCGTRRRGCDGRTRGCARHILPPTLYLRAGPTRLPTIPVPPLHAVHPSPHPTKPPPASTTPYSRTDARAEASRSLTPRPTVGHTRRSVLRDRRCPPSTPPLPLFSIYIRHEQSIERVRVTAARTLRAAGTWVDRSHRVCLDHAQGRRSRWLVV